MGNIGFRDGEFNVRSLKLAQKKLQYDIYPYYASTLTTRVASSYGWLAATTVKDFGSTTFSCPRNLVFKNNMGAAAERKLIVRCKGYTAQGEYVDESVTLSSAAAGYATTNNAFAYLASVVPAVAQKGYGTYGSVALRLGDKVGLSEYCEDVTDILQVMVGTSKAMAGSTRMVSSASLFDKTYQTLDVSGSKSLLIGSTLGLVYLSKFQRRNKN